MRRIFSLVIVLGLAGLVPVPLSACAIFSAQLAECATPKTQSRCDQMNMDDSGTRLVAASDTSCCTVSTAPIPELQPKTYDPFLAAPIAILDLTGDTHRIQRLLPALIILDTSPPTVQSLLCTFLI